MDKTMVEGKEEDNKVSFEGKKLLLYEAIKLWPLNSQYLNQQNI